MQTTITIEELIGLIVISTVLACIFYSIGYEIGKQKSNKETSNEISKVIDKIEETLIRKEDSTTFSSIMNDAITFKQNIKNLEKEINIEKCKLMLINTEIKNYKKTQK